MKQNWLKYLLIGFQFIVQLLTFGQAVKEKGSIRDAITAEIKDRLDGVNLDAFQILSEIGQAIGQVDAKSTKFFQDVLATIVDGEGQLTPVGVAIKDALADGKLERKELILIILAYELYSGDVSYEALKTSDALAKLLDYARPFNVAQQVNRKLDQLKAG